MGAGQIGGIATLLDMDFKNAATFLGEPSESTEAQYVAWWDTINWKQGGTQLLLPIFLNYYVARLQTQVHYLSHAMLFCMGVLIEAHVVLTPASCVYGERYKFNVLAGTHMFIENTGVFRTVNHLCVHRGYNTSHRWADCSTDNLALLVLSQQFSFHHREPGSDFLLNRVRYGISTPRDDTLYSDKTCRYYGWGSRRNGYLIPLLVHLRRMDVTLLPKDRCLAMFNYQEKFLCIQQSACRSQKFGALCPDDVGSVIVCSGFALGMMTSRLMDRPCGVGFLDLSNYAKFLTCGVDDSRDVIGDNDINEVINTSPVTPEMSTLPPENSTSDEADPTPPKSNTTTTIKEEV